MEENVRGFQKRKSELLQDPAVPSLGTKEMTYVC